MMKSVEASCERNMIESECHSRIVPNVLLYKARAAAHVNSASTLAQMRTIEHLFPELRGNRSTPKLLGDFFHWLILQYHRGELKKDSRLCSTSWQLGFKRTWLKRQFRR